MFESLQYQLVILGLLSLQISHAQRLGQVVGHVDQAGQIVRLFSEGVVVADHRRDLVAHVGVQQQQLTESFVIGGVTHARLGATEATGALGLGHDAGKPVPEEESEHQFAGVVQQCADPVVVERDRVLERDQLLGVELVGDNRAGDRMLPITAQVEFTVAGLNQAVDQFNLLGDRPDFLQPESHDNLVQRPAAALYGAGKYRRLDHLQQLHDDRRVGEQYRLELVGRGLRIVDHAHDAHDDLRQRGQGVYVAQTPLHPLLDHWIGNLFDILEDVADAVVVETFAGHVLE